MIDKNDKRKAVILFNIGGPSNQTEVEGFLFNLFNDPAIIKLPVLLRWPVAKFISKKRKKYAQNLYRKIGNASPILKETQAQAKALEKKLNTHGSFKVFVAMRYSSPNSKDVVKTVKKYNPDEIILLTLFPQYSTTTTETSFKKWIKESKKVGLKGPLKTICCYPENEYFIKAHTDLVLRAIDEIKPHDQNYKILFSAHGLPQKTIDGGDPYEFQVGKTVNKVVEKLKSNHGISPEFLITYQSRVGPLKWLTPSTRDEIIKAGQQKKALIVSPISFVSEHSETLVELDIDYKNLALDNGVLNYVRVPTLSNNKFFIQALTDLCLNNKGQSPYEEGFSKCFNFNNFKDQNV